MLALYCKALMFVISTEGCLQWIPTSPLRRHLVLRHSCWSTNDFAIRQSNLEKTKKTSGTPRTVIIHTPMSFITITREKIKELYHGQFLLCTQTLQLGNAKLGFSLSSMHFLGRHSLKRKKNEGKKNTFLKKASGQHLNQIPNTYTSGFSVTVQAVGMTNCWSAKYHTLVPAATDGRAPVSSNR